MTRRRFVWSIRYLALTALVVAGAAVLPVAAQAPVRNHAGLIVRHGDGRLTYALVAFPEETINGIELLRRSSIPLVSIPFGGLGEGVCSLDGEGCGAADCRRRVCQGTAPDAPFWQLFRQSAPGAWRPVVLGASATTVRDGDVDGWSWTGRDPRLPAATIADIARIVGAPSTPVAGDPVAFVRGVLPDGTAPHRPEETQPWSTYAAAAALIAAIGAAVLTVVRRGRHRLRSAAP